MHYYSREIPQNHHWFALFDHPKIGDLMTPVFGGLIHERKNLKEKNDWVPSTISLGWGRL